MAVLNDFNIRRLVDFREGLLRIPADELSYKKMEAFLGENRGAVDAFHAYNAIIQQLSPYQGVTDRAVLEAVREAVIEIINNQIRAAGGDPTPVLTASTTIQTLGAGIEGAQANTQAGTVRVSIQNGIPIGGVIIDHSADLKARVFNTINAQAGESVSLLKRQAGDFKTVCRRQ